MSRDRIGDDPRVRCADRGLLSVIDANLGV
jgi:hypothetical protein